MRQDDLTVDRNERRRSETGLRPAPGATRGRIRIQFLAEAILFVLVGGAVGPATGRPATAAGHDVRQRPGDVT